MAYQAPIKKVLISEEQINTRVKELAKQLGTSEIAIYLWETGQRKPKLDNIKKMAKIFKIDVEELTQYL